MTDTINFPLKARQQNEARGSIAVSPVAAVANCVTAAVNAEKQNKTTNLARLNDIKAGHASSQQPSAESPAGACWKAIVGTGEKVKDLATGSQIKGQKLNGPNTTPTDMFTTPQP